MKRLLIAALVATSAAGAMAQETSRGEGYLFKDNFVSQKTGAEVAAEVVKARANGTLLRAGEITGVVDPFVSRKTRAEVNAEVLRARAAGVLLRAGEAQPTAN